MNVQPVTSVASTSAAGSESSLTEGQWKLLHSMVTVRNVPAQQRTERQLGINNVPALSKLIERYLIDKHLGNNGAIDIARAERFFASGELNKPVRDEMREEYAHKLLTTPHQYDQYDKFPELAMAIAKNKVSRSEQWKGCWDTAIAHGFESKIDALHELCMAAVAGVAGERVRNGEDERVVRNEHQLFSHHSDAVTLFDMDALAALSNIANNHN